MLGFCFGALCELKNTKEVLDMTERHNDEWANLCKKQNEEWSEHCQSLIDKIYALEQAQEKLKELKQNAQ